jgi:DNA-binding GntR family transcriptional regulator
MDFKAPSNLAEHIADYIGDKIVRLEMAPGERIYEARLAEELGVSRSPIREALRILERKRLVELVPRRGARVTELTESYILDLYDIVKEILGLVAYRGVEKGSRKDFSCMRQILEEMRECADRRDVDAYQEAAFKFALNACKATRNPLLEEMISFLWEDMRRIQYAALTRQKDNMQENLRYFAATVEKFAARDA